MKRIMNFAIAAVALAAVAAAQMSVDETKAVGPNDSIEISNVNGKIEVEAWDRNEVRVSGTLGKNVERLEFNHEDDETEIRVINPKNGWRVGETNLVIQAPATNKIRVECVSGSVEVRDIRADMELRSVSGGVRATNCAGDVKAKSVSGSVKLDGDFGEVEAQTVSGSVHVKTVRDEVRAQSVSGSVEVEGVSPKKVECESTSGSVSYTGGLAPDAKLEASTHSGSVKLRLPADVSARVHAETFSGGINNDLSGAQTERPKYGPGASLNTKFGSGSANIDASAFSGSVTLTTK